MTKSTKPKAPWTRMRNAALKGPGGRLLKWPAKPAAKRWANALAKKHGQHIAKKATWTLAFPEQVDTHVADHTKAERTAYRVAAKEFIKQLVKVGARCPVVQAIPELRNGRRYGHPISDKLNQVHHKFGRQGRLLNWQAGWLAVSKQGHRWIHQNIAEARRRGWYAQPGEWNNQKVIPTP